MLEENEQGFRKLAVLNTRTWTNRPRWKFHYSAPEPNLWTPSQTAMIKKSQQYLIKYGEVLVEANKLAP